MQIQVDLTEWNEEAGGLRPLNPKTISLPFGGNTTQEISLIINAPMRRYGRFSYIRRGAKRYLLAGPHNLKINCEPSASHALSPGSDADYLAHCDEIFQGMRYGLLLQVLQATKAGVAGKWERWAYTSLHYHVGDGNGYHGPTEYFFPLYGACEMRIGDSGWSPLSGSIVINPGVKHQLRSSDLAINLLIMQDIRDPEGRGVRSTRNHHYCQF